MKINLHASRCRGFLAAVIVQAAVLAAATSAHAALITWGAATNINPAGGAASDLDVSTAGTFVGALALRPGSGTANTTVNGVTFTGVDTFFTTSSGVFSFPIIRAGFSFPSPLLPFRALSASYQSLLTTGTNDGGFTLTMSDLSVGGTYAFEFWSNKTGDANSLTTATAGNSVILSSDPTGVAGGLGQFAIGTFVADSATEQVVFSGASVRVNGFQLRQTALPPPIVPEPGTALAGVLMVGLCGAVRRRRAVAQG